MTDIEKGSIGSSLDDFLREDGIYEEVTAGSIKRVIAWQLAQVMEAENITKTQMAAQLSTSRAQLNRLLDPDNDGVSIGALERAAKAVGRKLTLELS